ncbi:hypothetical protein AB0F46_39030 [Streptomyces sp. NPDC026665]|uniref:hypothetical protein n=1 Tax=Streptomyces sp. NPDC026665 TaxID=3154798 RepID=UPI00340CFDFA
MIILAGALGALLLALLFRRLRRLSRQLAQLRVERDCERILRDIGMTWVAETKLHEVEDAQPATPIDAPVRRKGHLSLYLGQNVSGFLTQRRNHRHLAVAAGTAVIATAAVVAALVTVPGSGFEGSPDRGPDIVTHAGKRPGRSPTDTPDPSDPAPTDVPTDPATPVHWDSTTDIGLKVATVVEPSPQTVASAKPTPRHTSASPPGTSGASTPPPTHTAPQPSPRPTATNSPALNVCASVKPLVGLCLGL